VPSPSDLPCCRFLKTLLVATACSCYFLFKRDKLELALWLLCSVHAAIQVSLDGAVGSRNSCCHCLAACTVDASLAVCFIRQTVSALTSGLSRYSAQPTPCLLHVAYFGQKTGCWCLSCHHHPQSSPSMPWHFFVTQILPQHKPFCILSQHEVYYPFTFRKADGCLSFFPSP